MNNKKFEKLVIDCYTEIYQNTTPKANFKELLKTYQTDGNDFYDNYVINAEVEKDIVEKYVKVNKMSNVDAQSFRLTIYLGVSPKYAEIEPHEPLLV